MGKGEGGRRRLDHDVVYLVKEGEWRGRRKTWRGGGGTELLLW